MARITERDAALIADYEAGQSLRQLARKFGVSMQRVHQIVVQHAPGSMRPAGQSITRDRDLPAVGSFGGC